MSESMSSRLAIVAPPSTAQRLQNILAGASLTADAVYSAGNDAIASECEEGALILTTWKLPDMTGEDLADRLSDAYDVLMIVPQDYPASTDKDAALTLRNPITQDALIQSVRAVRHCRARMQSLRGRVRKLERTLEDRKVIDKAKGRLMDSMRMSEAEAHHFLQKRSMDTGRRIAEVAQDVLSAEHITQECSAN